MAVTRDMDPAYKAAYKKTASWLFKAVQERGLSLDEVEAGVERVKSSMR